MTNETRPATVATGQTYITVTRAHAHACNAHKELSAASVAPYAPPLTFPAGVECWLHQRCDLDPAANAMTADLFADWQDWAHAQGCYPGTVKLFACELGRLGFPKHKTSRSRGFRGIVLKPCEQQADVVAAAPFLDERKAIAGALLALDLGTTTGWALRIGCSTITSGRLDLAPNRYDGGGMRYLRLRNWLEQLRLDSGGIEAIHFEEVRRHAGTSAAHVYGGLLATLTGWCEERAVAYQGVPVGTIKRFIAGKGNADKAAVITAVRERGYAPADDNEADAIAILLWALQTTGGVR